MKTQKTIPYVLRNNLKIATAFFLVLSLGLSSTASAQNTWTGDGTNNNFSNGDNWFGGIAPAPGTDSDYIFEGTPPRLQPSLIGGNYQASSITFAVDAASFTITGETTTANTRFRTPSYRALTITQNSANDQRIDAILTGTTVIVEGSGAGLLTFGGIRAENTTVLILNRDTIFSDGFFTTTNATRNANFTIGRDNSATATFNSDPFAGILSGTRNIVLGNSQNVTTGELNIGSAFSTQGNLEVRSGLSPGRRAIISGPGSLALGGDVTFDGNGSRLLEITNSSSGGVTFSGNTTLGGASAAREVTFDVTSGSTLSMAMLQDSGGGAGSFFQTGDGTIILTGDNTYTGTTTVNSGTLIVNGDQTAATGGTFIAVGGTLAGTGTLGGEIILRGTLSPGNSIGTLTVGQLSLMRGANMVFDLTSNLSPGTTHDRILATHINLPGGNQTVGITLRAGGSPQIKKGDTFRLTEGRLSNATATRIVLDDQTDWGLRWDVKMDDGIVLVAREGLSSPISTQIKSEMKTGDDIVPVTIEEPSPERLAFLQFRDRLRVFSFENPSSNQVLEYARTMQADGSWEDLDYENRERVAGWPPYLHIQRMRNFAYAYTNPENELFGNPEILQAALKSLDFWIEHGPRHPASSGWTNFIGIPLTFGPTLLLLEEYLSPEQLEAGLHLMDFEERYKNWRGFPDIKYFWAGGEAAGQNRLWFMQIYLYKAVLRNQPDQIREILSDVQVELSLDRPLLREEHKGNEGIQADFSFHQHGPQLYNGGYGMAFTRGVAWFADLANPTAYAFEDEEIQLLIDFVLEGQRWMTFGTTFEYGAMGRDITRSGASSRGRGLLKTAEHLIALDRDETPQLQELIREINREVPPSLEGHRHFWLSDFSIHRRANFYTSVKMNSIRTLGTEAGAGEGLQNYYLADGATLTFRDGREYYDIFPVWDWTRIPGVTNEWLGVPPEMETWGRVDGVTSMQRGNTSFVGGVTDGTSGASVMDYDRDGVKARKAWFHFESEWVALGAGISGQTENPILTSVEQSLLRGDVEVKRGEIVGTGQSELPGSNWVLHNEIGYVFFDGQPFTVKREAQEGNWHSINLRHPDETVTMDVFSLWINHGNNPRDASYAYLVAPNATPDQLSGYLADDKLEILSNSLSLQAVRNNEIRLIQAVFYEAGSLELGDHFTLEVDKPCLLMIRFTDDKATISASNPKNEKITITVRLTAPNLLEEWVMNLPGGNDAGKTVTKTVDLGHAL